MGDVDTQGSQKAEEEAKHHEGQDHAGDGQCEHEEGRIPTEHRRTEAEVDLPEEEPYPLPGSSVAHGEYHSQHDGDREE